MDSKVRAWRDDQKHLPHIMRDFHDCKDLFKLIDHFTRTPEDHPANAVTWVQAHCYTVDVFLWFMARHGYTLQKSRSRLPFDDLSARLEESRQDRSSSFNAILSAMEAKQ